ncbi:cyclic-di-AMP-binding protein CbpB [Lederbergia galactosidilytica]|uniref:CBS domain-containing protein YkuL n=1 Tax=Lederbergia galactosidilytica TaxID=217031 RepID=A0A0Q9XS33_9BACI|nr:cyclic-di-AMP-binding protein CbpB [Lederbergia galactosidilytica]KRG10902.1 CBS domain-containing protein YkuL [Lederbergia galactosidilytica]KRG16010.1 CBS domain-containing protein YkuL [Virgibacillus soli]MBP1915597.1 putative transcriptional regulator [Lederbergia galactosidilytica]OAK72964.1 CBS domain-containing protein YkuL [Lederbergia galactosidilytica]
MISLQSHQNMNPQISDYIIPSEKVAHVQIGNNLEHALLVLTKSGYSAIPVLDARFKLHGLISSPLITESILGLERIEFEKLSDKKVEDVMQIQIPKIRVDEEFEKALDLLIDYPFLCVEDREGFFEGIFTRRILLKELKNYLGKLDHV